MGDNSAVNIDITELLQRIVPTPEEVKLYNEYQFHKKDLMKLTEEDRLMARLSRARGWPPSWTSWLLCLHFMNTSTQLDLG